MNQRYLTLTVNKVVFPNSLGIVEFEEESAIELLKEASNRNLPVILVPKSKQDSVITEGDIGVLVEIEQLLSTPFDDHAKLAYRAEDTVRVHDVAAESTATRSAMRPFAYEKGRNIAATRALFQKAQELYSRYNELIGGIAGVDTLHMKTINTDMDTVVSRLRHCDRFPFFSTVNTEDRLLLFIKLLTEAIEIAEIDETVSQKVKEAMDLNQREFYVREQIRALSAEIDEEDETEDYLEKIEALNAPEQVKEKLKKETKRIRRTAPASPDMAILKNYLDTVLELPWGVYTADNEDLNEAQRILDEDHYGLEKVKERLIEALAVRKLSKSGKSPIICLVGPPGIGKTSIARSIARAMNKNYVRLSFGGVRDEAEIRGHRKTYVGAMPGRIITSIKSAESMNPIFLMDEIDKMASDYKGDPASALLEVLDPEQNVNFRDHFVELPFDLSKVLFITTANTLDTISRPLLDRMEIIEMTGYTELEKLEIAKRHLVRKAMEQCGVKESWVTLTDEALEEIIACYTRESGVRGLEKQIGAVMRKVARKYVDATSRKRITITKKNLRTYLGEPKFAETVREKEDQVGVVTGLAWTAVGGDTLAIEVMITPGKGELLLTGNLGQVMQESAKIALSYCRGMEESLHLPPNFFKEHDIHIHVPEGATPKDGPSAGITIATALFSALSKKKVDHSVAMTGELTLRGNVLPIGGLKEKTLAAVRAGIKRVYVPEENKKDYNDLPEAVKTKLEFVFVSNVKHVIKSALL